MNGRPTAPARLPGSGITGLDPHWSRLVPVPAIDGTGRTWHLLDTWAGRSDVDKPRVTLLCVHGNPTWSFLWRDLLRQVVQADDARVRVIAVDQLDMGFSERTGRKRTLATRIDDLCHLTAELSIKGPVIAVAHDWGGPISLGWALRHVADQSPIGPDRSMGEHTTSDNKRAGGSHQSDQPILTGVVLTNTAVHQPAGFPAPAVIRLLRSPALLQLSTVYTRAFIQGAIEMSRPRLPAAVRSGFHAPYLARSQRLAIADFVADIPLDSNHESVATLDAITAGLPRLAHTPALLLWGPRDRVFSDLYLHDLEQRLPHAAVHRFPKAAHFVTEDADVAGAILAWVQQPGTQSRAPESRPDRRALADLSKAEPAVKAVVEIAPSRRSITFGELATRVDHLAAGMSAFGIRSGDRVAVMVTPGIDLSLAVYGCWRLGATLVLVDSGLGRHGMQQALRSANPAWLIGIDKALIAARILGWPGRRIATRALPPRRTRFLKIVNDLQSLIELGKNQSAPPWPGPDTFAALAFTSGATGPSKGVLYRHHQIQAQRDALMALYRITPRDRLVAAFAPFALYGPTMGITSMIPDMDVTAPGTLTARALADAVRLIEATLVFASPAALVNIIATATSLSQAHQEANARVRLALSAGAPVRTTLLKQASALYPGAELHTPYGMTEILPVADISLAELESIGPSDRSEKDHSEDSAHDKSPSGHDPGTACEPTGSAGVCVGRPLPGVELAIDPLNALGNPIDRLSTEPDVLGEIVLRAAHARDGYDRLWHTGHRASQPPGWHRTADIGQLDTSGRLWVGGRLGHVISTPGGPVAPVAGEQRIETLEGVALAALVGTGPVGAQVLVAVLQMSAGHIHPPGGASLELADRVRQAAGDGVDLAAVLVARKLPVDRRHNSKVDRTALACWAGRVLAGERVTTP